MDPYVQKPILRYTDMTHSEDCAVKVYQAPFCTCGALNRWLASPEVKAQVLDSKAA